MNIYGPVVDTLTSKTPGEICPVLFVVTWVISSFVLLLYNALQ